MSLIQPPYQFLSSFARRRFAIRGKWAAAAVGGVLTCAGFVPVAPAEPSLTSVSASEPVMIDAKRKPTDAWQRYPVKSFSQILESSSDVPQTPAQSIYGGRLDRKWQASGYFRVQQDSGRWWMVDPQGHPLIRMAVNSVYRRGSEHLDPNEIPTYIHDDAAWAQATARQLQAWGFNGLGRWSEFEVFRDADQPIAYTTSLKFMSDFGGELGVTYQKYGHSGYRHDNIPVFHPDFPTFCDEYARKHAAPRKDDPFLVGHYSDNELPAPRNLLDQTLALDPDDAELHYNREAAWLWFRQRRGDDARAEQATVEDNAAWLGQVFDRYYRITTSALRRHDPNHLKLGSRLHGAAPKLEPVIVAAGHHLDVISINIYGVWEPEPKSMRMWHEVGGRPFLVSEFCIKAADTALDNGPGAGWIVRTQADRGRWYQNFVLRLLENGHCIGWDYFKYRDDLDVNKGILSHNFSPHDGFVGALQQTHHLVYPVVDALGPASPISK